jgi:5-methylthioribose kinase
MLTSSVVLLHGRMCLHTAAWKSQHFNNNEELMEGIKTYLSSQAADFWHRHTESYSATWQVPQLQQRLHQEVAQVCKYFFVSIINLFLIACFVNRSRDVTFQIALV